MQQQQGGSQYGVPPPDMTQFASPGAGPRAHMLGIPSGPDHHQQPPLAETASPISSRPPPSRQNFDELVSAAATPGSFPDDDALAASEEVERGGVPGNRWPRQETLALLKIRSDMDAAFRDATLKGPLWETVSRQLAELGYTRSAKKCKEKFENVHKYYKRTKEGRAGRQDGKSYRFFSQLEALHSGSSNTTIIPTTMANPTTTLPALTPAAAPTTTTTPAPSPTTLIGISSSMPGSSSAREQPPPVSAPTPTPTVTPARAVPDLTPTAATQGISSSAAAAGISFSSDTFSSSASDDDDEESGASGEGRKRKRGGGPTGSRKMMAFFEGLMKQVIERQEAMQQRFLETIEKREQDRMIREEAWKRQEMARLNREHELLAQERAMAASRDAAVISFLQKISGQAFQLPPAVAIPAAPPPQPSPAPQPPLQQRPQQPSSAPPPPLQQPSSAPPPLPQQPQKPAQPPQQPSSAPPPLPQHQQTPPAPPLQPPPPLPQQQQQPHEHHHQHRGTEIVRNQPSSSSTELVPVLEPHEVVASGNFEGLSPSRWPKSEVHALIKLRSGLDGRYQEAGPKGPLWEEISSGMQRLGYNRSAKRCKEKWENINKYFKKVKESNKKRPEDAKTCPYFHQLDALYRKKLLGSSSGSGSTSSGVGVLGNQRQQEQDINPNPNAQERSDVLMNMAPPPAPLQHPHPETESKNGNNRNGGNPEGAGSSGGIQIQTSNGGLPPSFFEEGTGGSTTMKKPEDIVKELMEQQHQQGAMDDYDKLEEPDSDNIDHDDDDDDDDDEEDRKMQYKIQFQRQNVGGGGNASAKAAATAAAGSFLAMVQ